MKRSFNKKYNSKTIKKRTMNLNSVDIKYYSLKYKNTKYLPKTQIMNYMFKNFNSFVHHARLCEALNVNPLSLEDCFTFMDNDFPNGLSKNNINTSLKMNSKMHLDKLISYCYYIKQPNIFYYPENKINETIKYQIGKDISRDERLINNKMYNQNYYIENIKTNSDVNYRIADLFYQNIIDHLYKINKRIDLNIVNKFGLLSAQNVYGLISDLIIDKLFQMLKPEMSYMFNAKKHVEIIINPNNISMEFHFATTLLITQNNKPVDIEYPCGNMEFIFLVDILNNKYELSKFVLNYDINKCGPELRQEDNSKPSNSKVYMKPKYVVPALAATSGIVATPFLLSLLGGKTKKNKTMKKRQKNK